MAKNKKPEREEMLRSVALYRVKDDQKGKLPNDRLYRPYEESPSATIPELIDSLGNIYDLVILHDPYDGCLLLDLQKSTKKADRVSKLPCKLHSHE